MIDQEAITQSRRQSSWTTAGAAQPTTKLHPTLQPLLKGIEQKATAVKKCRVSPEVAGHAQTTNANQNESGDLARAPLAQCHCAVSTPFEANHPLRQSHLPHPSLASSSAESGITPVEGSPSLQERGECEECLTIKRAAAVNITGKIMQQATETEIGVRRREHTDLGKLEHQVTMDRLR